MRIYFELNRVIEGKEGKTKRKKKRGRERKREKKRAARTEGKPTALLPSTPAPTPPFPRSVSCTPSLPFVSPFLQKICTLFPLHTFSEFVRARARACVSKTRTRTQKPPGGSRACSLVSACVSGAGSVATGSSFCCCSVRVREVDEQRGDSLSTRSGVRVREARNTHARARGVSTACGGRWVR